MKLGKIELSEWTLDSPAAWSRYKIKRRNISSYDAPDELLSDGTLAILIYRYYDNTWEPGFYEPLLFCCELYSSRIANINEAKKQMDEFLTRINNLMMFI